jgi:conjugative transposon TraN protein
MSALIANSQRISNYNDYSLERVTLPVIYINENANILFRSPETIQFIDLSSDEMIGDIPVANVARIKIDDNLYNGDYPEYWDLGVISIIGESYMAQYSLIYSSHMPDVVTQIEILPKHMKDLDYPKYDLTEGELKSYCMDIIKERKGRNVRKKRGYNVILEVNRIYSFDKYVFIDVQFENKTDVRYDLDKIIFAIADKRIYRSTNNQTIYLKPVYQLYDNPYFKKKHRNVFVFEKFTFPGNKRFVIRLTEDQISGRTIQVEMKYKDLLNADTF